MRKKTNCEDEEAEELRAVKEREKKEGSGRRGGGRRGGGGGGGGLKKNYYIKLCIYVLYNVEYLIIIFLLVPWVPEHKKTTLTFKLSSEK